MNNWNSQQHKYKYRQADEISPDTTTGTTAVQKSYVFVKPYNWLGLITYKAGDGVQGIEQKSGNISILADNGQYVAVCVPPEFLKVVEGATPPTTTPIVPATPTATPNAKADLTIPTTAPTVPFSSLLTTKNILIGLGVAASLYILLKLR